MGRSTGTFHDGRQRRCRLSGLVQLTRLFFEIRLWEFDRYARTDIDLAFNINARIELFAIFQKKCPIS